MAQRCAAALRPPARSCTRATHGSDHGLLSKPHGRERLGSFDTPKIVSDSAKSSAAVVPAQLVEPAAASTAGQALQLHGQPAAAFVPSWPSQSVALVHGAVRSANTTSGDL